MALCMFHVKQEPPMANEVETFLACPVCKLVQFRVDRVDRGSGHFTNEIVPQLAFKDYLTCETDGVPLERSDGQQSPDAVMPPSDTPPTIADVLAAAGKLSALNIVVLADLEDGT